MQTITSINSQVEPRPRRVTRTRLVLAFLHLSLISVVAVVA